MKRRAKFLVFCGLISTVAAAACIGEDPAVVVVLSPDAAAGVDAAPAADADADAGVVNPCETLHDLVAEPDAGAREGWAPVFVPTGQGKISPLLDGTTISADPQSMAYYQLDIPDRRTVTRVRVQTAIETNGTGDADLAVVGVYVRDGINTRGHVDIAREQGKPFAGFAPGNTFEYTHLVDGAPGLFLDGKPLPFDLVIDGSWGSGNGPNVQLSVNGNAGAPQPFPITLSFPPEASTVSLLTVVVGVVMPVEAPTVVKLRSLVVEVCRSK